MTDAFIEPELFLGGKWTSFGQPDLDVENPATGIRAGVVARSGPEGTARAVAAARAAFDDGPWPRLSPAARSEALGRLAAALRAREEGFIRRIVADVGCPVTQARSQQVRMPLGHWDTIASLARRDPETPLPPIPGNFTAGLCLAEPLGVVAAITAYNYPLMLATWKVGPALAAGCTVVLKPADVTPLAAFELCRAVEEADLPPGVVNLVVGGAGEGRRLVGDPKVDAVTFTGSTAVGRSIMADGAATLKRLVLELGGKSAAVVLDDADVDGLVAKVVWGCMINAGQSCGATTRLIVAENLLDSVLEKVTAVTAALRIGDPTDPSTDVGPLVSGGQRQRVETHLARATEDGGRFACGGARPAGLEAGHYIEPTVITGVGPDTAIAREEIFGPVMVVLPAADDDEAVRLANDSDYGLAAVVFARRRARAMAVARRLRAGTVGINGGAFNPHAPFGGYKQSGIGREGGPWGVDAFRELKHVSW